MERMTKEQRAEITECLREGVWPKYEYAPLIADELERAGNETEARTEILRDSKSVEAEMTAERHALEVEERKARIATLKLAARVEDNIEDDRLRLQRNREEDLKRDEARLAEWRAHVAKAEARWKNEDAVRLTYRDRCAIAAIPLCTWQDKPGSAQSISAIADAMVAEREKKKDMKG